MEVALGHGKQLIRFRLIFKVTVGFKLPSLSPFVLVCTISHELVGRFQPELHGYNIVT